MRSLSVSNCKRSHSITIILYQNGAKAIKTEELNFHCDVSPAQMLYEIINDEKNY